MTRFYKKITDQDRQRLIAAVNEQGLSIKKASEEANIPYENAKAMLRIYREESRTVKRTTRRRQKSKKITKEHSDKSNAKLII